MTSSGLSQWYDSVRAPGYPSFRQVETVAKNVRKSFQEKLEIEDFESEIWKTLITNLKSFDPQKGDVSKTLDERFLSYFACLFKKRLHKSSAGLEDGKGKNGRPSRVIVTGYQAGCMSPNDRMRRSISKSAGSFLSGFWKV